MELLSITLLLSAILCSLGFPLTGRTYLPRRLIALEEHASFPSLGTANTTFYQQAFKAFPNALSAAKDVGTGRLRDMDAGHVSIQVLSQLPGIGNSNPTGCSGANNDLAAAIAAHPDRYSGFAVLPMSYPEQAAKELERAIIELKLVGAMIDNHLENGTYYDNERFWTVFETAERLDVPIYIHPAPPAAEDIPHSYQGNYPASTAFKFSSAAYGWHEHVALHIIRLYAAGLFDRFPKLKIILGHDGEFLPMMIDRVDDNHLRNGTTLAEVWDTNIWVTVAGFFHLRNFEMLLKITKSERVMYSVDYPLVNTTVGWAFIEDLAASGILSRKQMEMFAYKTAEQFLRLPGPR